MPRRSTKRGRSRDSRSTERQTHPSPASLAKSAQRPAVGSCTRTSDGIQKHRNCDGIQKHRNGRDRVGVFVFLGRHSAEVVYFKVSLIN
jgi:hypothetical protein